MIVPKLLTQEVLNQISNYKTIQYQFKFDEPVSIEVVKNLFLRFLLEPKKHLIKLTNPPKYFLHITIKK